MSRRETNTFWGLPRRLPRFAELPPASLLEGLGMGALAGTFFITLGYIVQDIWFAELQVYRAFSPEEYLKVFAAIFAGTLALGLIVFIALRATPPKPELTDDISFRRSRLWLAMLREHTRLKTLDWLLIVLLLGASGVSVFVYKIKPENHWREWPIGAASLLTLLLLRTFRRNPFVPIVRPVALPAWVDELIAQTSDLPSENKKKAARRAFCLQHHILDQDECSDPATYFSYILSEDLPSEIKVLGIQCGPGVKERMSAFLGEHGGTFYQSRKYQGSVDMVHLRSEAFQGVGLLEMKRLAAQILTRAHYAKWSRWQLAEVVLQFVQRSIQYAEDHPTTGHSEYGRFPLQTLLDGEGDCECTALLCCALLSYLGFESGLVLSDTSNGAGHALSALRPPPDLPAFYRSPLAGGAGSQWLYGETTLDNDVSPWHPHQPPGVTNIERIVSIPSIIL